MCGLFGAYSHTYLDKSEVDRVMELGFMSSLRGIDSTGVAAVRQKPGNGKWSINYQKDTVNPVSFLSRFSVEKFLREPNPSILLGHARALTIGANTVANAHPVIANHIYGCHNGTMLHFAPSANDKEKKSDSRGLFESIAEIGLTKTLGKTSFGAYALSFVDIKEKTLNFIRNDERPLWFVRAHNQTLYWASELRFLECMMAEYGGPERYNTPYTCLKQELHRIEWGKAPVDIIPKEDAIKAAYYTNYPVIQQTAQITSQVPIGRLAGGLFCKACTWRMQICNCPKNSSKTYVRPPDNQISACGRYYNPGTSVPAIKASVPYTTETYLGFERNRITMGEAVALLNAEGCANCNQKKTADDKTYWFDDKSYVCRDCYLGVQSVKDTLKAVKVYGSSKLVERHN